MAQPKTASSSVQETSADFKYLFFLILYSVCMDIIHWITIQTGPLVLFCSWVQKESRFENRDNRSTKAVAPERTR